LERFTPSPLTGEGRGGGEKDFRRVSGFQNPGFCPPIFSMAEVWHLIQSKDSNYKTDSSIARALRRRLTDAEKVLWKHLRKSSLEGVKFRRQQPIGPYVVDFISFSKKIIVEVDGGQHAVNWKKDQERDQYFLDKGFHVKRYWNNEVLQSIEAVLTDIRQEILRDSPSS
jgi:very-short-patch-repair endonuclease